MAFISVADELTKKSSTSVDNKFILKYLAELEPVSVKVYLYALFLAQNGQTGYTLADFAAKLKFTEEQVKDCFNYLEEFELVSVTSSTPFEVRILDCENFYGKPKKLHPEKYNGLYEELQSIVGGRMITQDEFRDYLILLEDYNFERNALVMIVNYCVNLKGNDISAAYIKKVAKSFYAEGVTSARLVEEKLSSYTACTSALLKLFTALKITRRPEVDDGNAYEKWLNLGFSDEAILCASKRFKIKNIEKLNGVMNELYKNRKFDPKEIEDYHKTKDSLYETAVKVAKSLGIFLSDPTPYVENYIGVWCAYGFSAESLVSVANYCFLSGLNSFDAMNDFIKKLYSEAYVDDNSVTKLLENLAEDDLFIKKVLSACGLTRKIISYDRQALSRWRNWGFNGSMILKAAEFAAGKSNPMAFVNYLLSTWKNAGIYTLEQIPADAARPQNVNNKKSGYCKNPEHNSLLDEFSAAFERANSLTEFDDKDEK